MSDTTDSIMGLAEKWRRIPRGFESTEPAYAALRAAVERVISQKDNWKHEAIEYANKADYWRERAKATEVGCEKYLKEGETPAERIERDHRDSLALMGLLAKEKIRAEAAEQDAARLREDALRYRWLTEDLVYDERAKRDKLFDRMAVMGKGAIDAAIDAAMQEGK